MCIYQLEFTHSDVFSYVTEGCYPIKKQKEVAESSEESARCFLESLLEKVEQGLASANQNVLQAARQAPSHGG